MVVLVSAAKQLSQWLSTAWSVPSRMSSGTAASCETMFLFCFHNQGVIHSPPCSLFCILWYITFFHCFKIRSKRDLLLELTAVGCSEAELEPARQAPFWQVIQEPTPNSLLPTQKQPDVPEAILTKIGVLDGVRCLEDRVCRQSVGM